MIIDLSLIDPTWSLNDCSILHKYRDALAIAGFPCAVTSCESLTYFSNIKTIKSLVANFIQIQWKKQTKTVHENTAMVI